MSLLPQSGPAQLLHSALWLGSLPRPSVCGSGRTIYAAEGAQLTAPSTGPAMQGGSASDLDQMGLTDGSTPTDGTGVPDTWGPGAGAWSE